MFVKESAQSALEARDLSSFVEAISEPDFDVNKDYGEDIPRSLIHIAVEEGAGQDDFVRVLISAGARPDKRNPVLETIPFHEAVRKHDPELLKLLVRNVRDINIQDGCGSTALHIATEELIDADQVNHNFTFSFQVYIFCVGGRGPTG